MWMVRDRSSAESRQCNAPLFTKFPKAAPVSDTDNDSEVDMGKM